MMAVGRLFEAHQLERLEDLLEVELLRHVDDADRSIDTKVLELALCEGEVLRRVEAVPFERSNMKKGRPCSERSMPIAPCERTNSPFSKNSPTSFLPGSLTS